jgi:hypothetical protein
MAHQADLFSKRRRGRKAKPALEFVVHCMIADALRVSLSPGWLWFHPANGELRSDATGARLKRMGVLAGCSDFILAGPPEGRLHALELKRQGEQPGEHQQRFLALVEACGGRSAWVDSFDAAIVVLGRWGAVRAKL